MKLLAAALVAALTLSSSAARADAWTTSFADRPMNAAATAWYAAFSAHVTAVAAAKARIAAMAARARFKVNQ